MLGSLASTQLIILAGGGSQLAPDSDTYLLRHSPTGVIAGVSSELLAELKTVPVQKMKQELPTPEDPAIHFEC